jgi:hypothetical protein
VAKIGRPTTNGKLDPRAFIRHHKFISVFETFRRTGHKFEFAIEAGRQAVRNAKGKAMSITAAKLALTLHRPESAEFGIVCTWRELQGKELQQHHRDEEYKAQSFPAMYPNGYQRRSAVWVLDGGFGDLPRFPRVNQKKPKTMGQ